MKAQALRLQEFNAPEPEPAPEQAGFDEAIAAARDEAYAKGFNDGVSTTAQALSAQAAELDAAILEAISDAAFTAHEARTAVLASLSDLVRALGLSVLPDLAAKAFGDLVEQELDALQAGHPGARFSLTLHPDQAARIGGALAGSPACTECLGDAALAPLEARIHWSAGFDRIAVDDTLATIRQAVTRHLQDLDELKEESDDGYRTASA